MGSMSNRLAASGGGVKVGDIRLNAANLNSIESGKWAKSDGSLVATGLYPELEAVLATSPNPLSNEAWDEGGSTAGSVAYGAGTITTTGSAFVMFRPWVTGSQIAISTNGNTWSFASGPGVVVGGYARLIAFMSGLATQRLIIVNTTAATTEAPFWHATAPGGAWTAGCGGQANGLADGSAFTPQTLAVNTAGTIAMFGAQGTSVSTGGTVWKTTNGTGWAQVGGSGTFGAELYAIGFGGGWWWVAASTGKWYSTDDGGSWVQFDTTTSRVHTAIVYMTNINVVVFTSVNAATPNFNAYQKNGTALTGYSYVYNFPTFALGNGLYLTSEGYFYTAVQNTGSQSFFGFIRTSNLQSWEALPVAATVRCMAYLPSVKVGLSVGGSRDNRYRFLAPTPGYIRMPNFGPDSWVRVAA